MQPICPFCGLFWQDGIKAVQASAQRVVLAGRNYAFPRSARQAHVRAGNLSWAPRLPPASLEVAETSCIPGRLHHVKRPLGLGVRLQKRASTSPRVVHGPMFRAVNLQIVRAPESSQCNVLQWLREAPALIRRVRPVRARDPEARRLGCIQGKRQQCVCQPNLYRCQLSTLAARRGTGNVRCLLWLGGFDDRVGSGTAAGGVALLA